jgi:hypothetical protein
MAVDQEKDIGTGVFGYDPNVIRLEEAQARRMAQQREAVASQQRDIQMAQLDPYQKTEVMLRGAGTSLGNALAPKQGPQGDSPRVQQAERIKSMMAGLSTETDYETKLEKAAAFFFNEGLTEQSLSISKRLQDLRSKKITDAKTQSETMSPAKKNYDKAIAEGFVEDASAYAASTDPKTGLADGSLLKKKYQAEQWDRLPDEKIDGETLFVMKNKLNGEIKKIAQGQQGARTKITVPVNVNHGQTDTFVDAVGKVSALAEKHTAPYKPRMLAAQEIALAGKEWLSSPPGSPAQLAAYAKIQNATKAYNAAGSGGDLSKAELASAGMPVDLVTRVQKGALEILQGQGSQASTRAHIEGMAQMSNALSNRVAKIEEGTFNGLQKGGVSEAVVNAARGVGGDRRIGAGRIEGTTDANAPAYQDPKGYANNKTGARRSNDRVLATNPQAPQAPSKSGNLTKNADGTYTWNAN